MSEAIEQEKALLWQWPFPHTLSKKHMYSPTHRFLFQQPGKSKNVGSLYSPYSENIHQQHCVWCQVCLHSQKRFKDYYI